MTREEYINSMRNRIRKWVIDTVSKKYNTTVDLLTDEYNIENDFVDFIFDGMVEFKFDIEGYDSTIPKTVGGLIILLSLHI